MKISGLSHARGIFFIGPTSISEVKDSTVYEPVKKTALWQLELLMKAWRSLSLPFQAAILLPTAVFLAAGVWQQEWFWLHAAILYLISFHFWFPQQLRRYHGAEHMAFTIRRQRLPQAKWMEADVRNAGCSTAPAFTACLYLAVLLPVHGLEMHGFLLIAAALGAALLTELLRRRFPERLFFLTRVSGSLQKNATTALPNQAAVACAVESLEKLINCEKTPVSAKSR
ncbi:hypothetical protein ACFO4L_16155 [Bacillus daqingensis]|uniref:DUF1385 domain-containing protein n=1 Tax=Bacillus daqingensis TaxID=872396 RepID=A0ABV9NXR7_9BACI